MYEGSTVTPAEIWKKLTPSQRVTLLGDADVRVGHVPTEAAIAAGIQDRQTPHAGQPFRGGETRARTSRASGDRPDDPDAEERGRVPHASRADTPRPRGRRLRAGAPAQGAARTCSEEGQHAQEAESSADAAEPDRHGPSAHAVVGLRRGRGLWWRTRPASLRLSRGGRRPRRTRRPRDGPVRADESRGSRGRRAGRQGSRRGRRRVGLDRGDASTGIHTACRDPRS